MRIRTIGIGVLLALLLGACGGSPSGASAIPGQIAFVSDRDGSRQIFVVRPDGRALTQITRGGSYHVAPAWSPDSRQLAYVSDRADRTWQIYVMNADGSGQRRLVAHPPASDDNPSWSPDGARIAFDVFYANNFDIAVVAADGSTLASTTHDATADTHPTWSPAGSRIAFESGSGDDKDDIYTMRADGSELTNLTNDPAHDAVPEWSPDGARIAFVSDRSGNRDVYLMSADGSGVTNLTNDPADDGSPTWSPDGAWLAFVSNRGGNFDIYTMRADGTAVTNLTHSQAVDADPAWGR